MNRYFVIYFIAGLFLFLGPLAGIAQIPPSLNEEEAQRLRLQAESLKFKELELKLLEEAFEGAIEPDTYIIGPGDYFAVDIGGEIQKSFQLPVTAEGVLIIPTVGGLAIDGLTLRAAQHLIKDAISEKYKSIEISANLLKMRRIRVHVTGKISNPGTYVVNPIDRVSDLIYRAGGLGIYAKHQELHIKHRNKGETIVDFSAYQQHGDLSQNPYVQGGDIIIVPPIDYSGQVVRVEG